MVTFGQHWNWKRRKTMTKKEFIELIEEYPDNAEIVVSNYTIAFNVTCVEYHELWNQIRLSEE